MTYVPTVKILTFAPDIANFARIRICSSEDDDGMKSGSTLSLPSSHDAGSPGRKKASPALVIISPERQVNEVTNKTTTKKASAPHLDIGSVDSLKPAAALTKRARKAK